MSYRYGLTYQEEVTIESLNAVTHGLSALLSLVACYFLFQKVQVESQFHILLAYLIYGASLVILFLNSTLYHAFTFTKFKSFLQKMDHVAIYILIVGTFTPYLLVGLNDQFGLISCIISWILAFIGILFEIFWTNKYPRLSTFMYIGLGWMSLIFIPRLISIINLEGILLLAGGGLLYTVGTIFYSMKHNKWMHVIWHLFVSSAAFLMFLSIYFYL